MQHKPQKWNNNNRNLENNKYLISKELGLLEEIQRRGKIYLWIIPGDRQFNV